MTLRLFQSIIVIIFGSILTLLIGFIGMVIAWSGGMLLYNIIIWFILYKRRLLFNLPSNVFYTYAFCALSVMIPFISLKYSPFLFKDGGSIVVFFIFMASLIKILIRRASTEEKLIMEPFMSYIRTKKLK